MLIRLSKNLKNQNRNMEKKIKKTTVYEACDGKQFLTSEECIKHETYLAEVANIKYYLVSHSPDLTETGCFTASTAVAVNRNMDLNQSDVVYMWAIDRFGFIGPGVMGYGLQRYFCVQEISSKEYFRKEHDKNRAFLSSKDIDGFPEKTNVIKEWKDRYKCE